MNVVATRSTPRFGDVPLRLSQGPLQGPESWTVAVRNDDTEGQEFAVTAVCVPEPGASGGLGSLGALAALVATVRRRA